MLKEVASYEKEVVTNEARIQKMRDEGKDPYGRSTSNTTNRYYSSLDIKKQEEVLQESYMMVPDSKGRLEKSILALSELLVSCGNTFFLPLLICYRTRFLMKFPILLCCKRLEH